MIKLLILLAVVSGLAYLSEKKARSCAELNIPYRVSRDTAYWFLLIVLILFAGLRTTYNDTENYIAGFVKTPVLSEHLRNPDSYNPFKNPLFYFLESALRTITDNPQWLIFLTSVFTQVCFIRFFKRYSRHFGFTVFLYVTYGTFFFSMAAIKQVMGMAVITLAIPFLERRNWIGYYLLVLTAMLIHTYAIFFAALPFFYQRPWKLFTFVVVAVILFILKNFEEIITEFMEQANELGKTLADYEVLDENTINILRLMVYSVVPLLSLVFCSRVFYNSKPMDNILVNMSILSFAFMCLGTQAGANMFARMATYFEVGTLCSLPWLLDQIFEKRSYQILSRFAALLFLIYFIYAFALNQDFFGQAYHAVPIWQLFRG